MRKMMLPALFGAAALTACTDARIAIPADVAAGTQQLALTGIGGWQDGQFRIGASEGRFSRRAEQVRFSDVFIRSRGMATFHASGPEFNGRAGGLCGFSEGEVDVGIVTLPAGRLTYNCRFDNGGELFLAEVPYGSGLLAGRSRAGEVRMGTSRVAVQAIHHAAGSSIPSGTPLGYRFSVNGRQVGAVDLNGGTKTLFLPTAPGPERDAVLMGSLALALFWDPA